MDMPDNNKSDIIAPEHITPEHTPHDHPVLERPAPENIATLENELRNRAKQQESLAQLGQRALAEPDLERLLNDAVSTVAMTLAVDFVKVLELLPAGDELLLRAGFGWKKELVGSVLTTTAANTYARYALDSGVPIVTADYAAETRFEVPQYLKDHKCVSGLSVAIAGRD